MKCRISILLIIWFLIFTLYSTLSFSQDTALNYFVDGIESFDEGKYESALRSFKKATEMEPTNLEFRYYLALTYSKLNKESKALEILNGLVKRFPKRYFKAYFDISAIYTEMKRYNMALNILNTAQRVMPKNARVQIEKGYVYKNIKDYKNAIRCFEEAAKLDSRFLQQSLYEKAVTYIEMDNFDKAEGLLNKAIGLGEKSFFGKNAKAALRNLPSLRRARSPYYATISFGYGYDDNVPLDPMEGVGVRPTGYPSNKEDQFQTFNIKGGLKFINKRDLALGIGYGIQCIGYKEWLSNNIFTHIPHMYIQYQGSTLFFRFDYEFNYYLTGGKQNGQDQGFFLTFGHESDERLRLHSFRPSFSIIEPYNLKTDINLIYEDKDYIKDLTPGMNLDSHSYAIELIQYYNFPQNGGFLRGGYKFYYEDAVEEENSYRNHEFTLGILYPLCWKVDLDLTGKYIRTVYQNYPVVGKRKDKNYSISVTLSRSFMDQFLFQLMYTYTNNNSNVYEGGIDPFKFEKNLMFISLSYFY